MSLQAGVGAGLPMGSSLWRTHPQGNTCQDSTASHGDSTQPFCSAGPLCPAEPPRGSGVHSSHSLHALMPAGAAVPLVLFLTLIQAPVFPLSPSSPQATGSGPEKPCLDRTRRSSQDTPGWAGSAERKRKEFGCADPFRFPRTQRGQAHPPAPTPGPGFSLYLPAGSHHSPTCPRAAPGLQQHPHTQDRPCAAGLRPVTVGVCSSPGQDWGILSWAPCTSSGTWSIAGL